MSPSANTNNKGSGGTTLTTLTAKTKSHHDQLVQNLIKDFADGRIVTELDTAMNIAIEFHWFDNMGRPYNKKRWDVVFSADSNTIIIKPRGENNTGPDILIKNPTAANMRVILKYALPWNLANLGTVCVKTSIKGLDRVEIWTVSCQNSPANVHVGQAQCISNLLDTLRKVRKEAGFLRDAGLCLSSVMTSPSYQR